MAQPRGEYQHRAGPHRHNDLIRILRVQFRYRRFYDGRLRSWVMKVNGIGTLFRPDVVDAAEEIVGVAVLSMGGTGRVQVGPTASYLEISVTKFQEIEDRANRIVHTCCKSVEFFPFEQVMTGLPALMRRGFRAGGSDLLEFADNALVDTAMNVRFKFGLPNEAWKYAENIRRRKNTCLFASHLTPPGSLRGYGTGSDDSMIGAKTRKLWT